MNEPKSRGTCHILDVIVSANGFQAGPRMAARFAQGDRLLRRVSGNPKVDQAKRTASDRASGGEAA